MEIFPLVVYIAFHFLPQIKNEILFWRDGAQMFLFIWKAFTSFAELFPPILTAFFGISWKFITKVLLLWQHKLRVQIYCCWTSKIGRKSCAFKCLKHELPGKLFQYKKKVFVGPVQSDYFLLQLTFTILISPSKNISLSSYRTRKCLKSY